MTPSQANQTGRDELVERVVAALAAADLSPLTEAQVRDIVRGRVDGAPVARTAERARARVPAAAAIGAVLSVVLAFVAQAVLEAGVLGAAPPGILKTAFSTITRPNAETLGVVLFATSAAAFAITAPPAVAMAAANRATRRPRQTGTARFARLVVVGLAALAYAASLILFATQGETPGVRVLWIAAMALLVVSALPFDRPAASGERARPTDSSPPFRLVHIAALAGIALIAFALRAYQLESVPDYFHGDVASIGLQSRDLLLGRETNLFKLGWSVHPMLAFMPTALTLSVFGDSLFGLRVAPLLAGVLMVIAQYLLVWRTFDSHRLAALAAGALAVTASHVVYSHMPTMLDPWTCTLIGWFLLVDGMRARRNISFVGAGLLIGMSFQLYHSGRLGAFILAAFLVYLVVARRHWITQNVPGFVLFVLGGLMVVGPNLLVFTQVGLITRGDAFVFSNPGMVAHLQFKYGVTSEQGVLAEQIRRSVLMFHALPDGSTQAGAYSKPLLTSAFAPLLWLGVGLGARRILGRASQPGAAIMLLTFLGGFISSVLTSDPPYWFRLAMLMFSAPFFVALALDSLAAVAVRVVTQASGAARSHQELGSRLATALVLALVGAAGFGDWLAFRRQSGNDANLPVLVARYVAKLPPGARICAFADWPATNEREVVFTAFPRPTEIVPAAPDADLAGRCARPGDAWLLSAQREDRLAALRAALPTGRVVEHKAGNGALAFRSFEVLP